MSSYEQIYKVYICITRSDKCRTKTVSLMLTPTALCIVLPFSTLGGTTHATDVYNLHII